jgi:poly(3-hydroxybutyrate) depolymerase
MTRLLERCSLIRSKNAGPFWLTFDIVARDAVAYRRIAAADVLTPELFTRLFGAAPDDIVIVAHERAEAVKVSFPRPGAPGRPGRLRQLRWAVVRPSCRPRNPGTGVPVVTETPVSPWDLPEGHPGREYLLGRTPLFALGADPRVSYCLYVPDGHTDHGEARPLLVAVHGSHRDVFTARETFAEFAERRDWLVLAPLFPANLTGPNDLDSYKLLNPSLRADLLLLAMVDEVAARWNARTDTFHLQGFSGGGQFAHRFFYLHPRRLASVSVSAPGRATLIDPARPWWQGTADIAERFGTRLDLAALRDVPAQLVAGELDTAAPLPGAPTRRQSIAALHENWREHGIQAELVTVPNAAHDARAAGAAAFNALEEQEK